jgi:hypothetical protein
MGVDKEMAPQVLEHPEARTTKGYFMATTESSASTAQERRIRRILEEATERFYNELLPDEERMVLLDRIKRLRRAVETSAATVDAVHSGLERL